MIKIDLVHIILFLVTIVLLGSCSVLIFYIRKKLIPLLISSEESVELFTRLDTYRDHLKSVYELPTFYGDETLKSLLDHTNHLFQYLQRYENIYSFTQPDLIEILEEIDKQYAEEEEKE